MKIKETCASDAEAYCSSEVLHGPLQLATNPLMTVIPDTGQSDVQGSLNTAAARLRATATGVFRKRATAGTHAAVAGQLLCMTYPMMLDTALALGHDPDRPSTLFKPTKTT